MEKDDHKCPKCGKQMQPKATRGPEKGTPTEHLSVWVCECGHTVQPFKKSN